MSGGTIDRIIELNRRVTTWLAWTAAIILALLALLTFSDVFGRYFLNRPFTFTVEMTEFAMGLMVYFAVGLATHQNEHISVDIVTLRLSPRTRAVMALVFSTNAAAFAFLVFVVWRLWLQAGLLYGKGDVTQILRVPIWPVAYAMAIGSLFLLTGVAVQFLEAWKALAGTAPTQPERGPRPGID